MATPAAIQSEADTANTMHVYQILQSVKIDGTYNAHYVQGITAPYAGKAKWIQTTASESAADQNTAIVAALVL